MAHADQPPAPTSAPAPDLAERLGPRARRRPLPRFGEAVAGAGGLMAVAGSLVTSFYELNRWVPGDAATPGGGRAPGIALSLLMVVVGYGALVLAGTGPVAAGGVAATLAAVPALVWFATLDTGGFAGAPDSTTVLAFSALAFGVAYLVGPGRGHSGYLGGVALALWLLVLEQIEPIGVPLFFFPLAATVGTGGADTSTNGLAMASLLIGAGYVLLALALDRRDLAGVATPLVAIGDLALVAGISLLAVEQEPATVGLVAVVIGAALALLGASAGRRATTWLGAFGVVAGLLVIIADAVDDPREFGLVTMFVGAGVVAAAAAIGAALQERPGEDAAP